jgi:hypothetical protein
MVKGPIWVMKRIFFAWMETSHDLTNLSHIFIVMGTNNIKILILWYCIQNGLHLMCHVYLVKFGIKQGHQVHIKIRYNNPPWNSKLSRSFERFWTWYYSFNSPLMLLTRGISPNPHEYGFKKICHQELWTSFEFEGVQAWKWHHIVGCRLHLLPYVWVMNNKIKCSVSFVGTQDHMWWWIEIETMIMPIKLDVNQNMNSHEILEVLVVEIHDFMFYFCE